MDIAVADVVGQDDDDVGLARGFISAPRAANATNRQPVNAAADVLNAPRTGTAKICCAIPSPIAGNCTTFFGFVPPLRSDSTRPAAPLMTAVIVVGPEPAIGRSEETAVVITLPIVNRLDELLVKV